MIDQNEGERHDCHYYKRAFPYLFQVNCKLISHNMKKQQRPPSSSYKAVLTYFLFDPSVQSCPIDYCQEKKVQLFVDAFEVETYHLYQ